MVSCALDQMHIIVGVDIDSHASCLPRVQISIGEDNVGGVVEVFLYISTSKGINCPGELRGKAEILLALVGLVVSGPNRVKEYGIDFA